MKYGPCPVQLTCTKELDEQTIRIQQVLLHSCADSAVAKVGVSEPSLAGPFD